MFVEAINREDGVALMVDEATGAHELVPYEVVEGGPGAVAGPTNAGHWYSFNVDDYEPRTLH